MRRLLMLLPLFFLTACNTQEWIAFRFSQVGADQPTIDHAIRVAECESGLNVNAVNGPYLGLFQMHQDYHAHRPGMDQPFTAQGNAAAAADLWREQGWGPWSCR